MEPYAILGLIENTVYWKLAEWRSNISELKYERSHCGARLHFQSTMSELSGKTISQVYYFIIEFSDTM